MPLFKAKRIFENIETLEAELDLYDYGQHKIKNPVFDLKIYNGEEIFYRIRTTERKISVPLDTIQKSLRLKIELSVGDYTNSWNIYVFAESKTNANVSIIKTSEELKDIIKNGGRAIVTADCVKNPIDGSFVPVFWSPVHFPSQKPCGAIIDDTHPIFKDFPTEKYPDYQWKTLLDNSKSVDISSFGNGFKPIIETVPNFVDNTPSSPLFEARVGNAEILYCGFDFMVEDTALYAMRSSLYMYVTDERFNPQNIISESEFINLIKYIRNSESNK